MEKLTIETLINKTFDVCDVAGVGQAELMQPELKLLFGDFLKQIRDEIVNKFSNYQLIYTVEVSEIFNNYLK